MCFPLNFLKFLRTDFFVEHLQWLFLVAFSDCSFLLLSLTEGFRNETA